MPDYVPTVQYPNPAVPGTIAPTTYFDPYPQYVSEVEFAAAGGGAGGGATNASVAAFVNTAGATRTAVNSIIDGRVPSHGSLANQPAAGSVADGFMYTQDDVSGGKLQQVRGGVWATVAAPFVHGKNQHLPWQADPIKFNDDMGLPFFTVPQQSSASTITDGRPYLYGDGINDDAPAINYAIQQANAAGGGVVVVPVGTWYVKSTIFHGFLPGSVPTTWTTANTPTPLAFGDTLPTGYTQRANITLMGGGRFATKIIRGDGFDGIVYDCSGVAGTSTDIARFARRCNLIDISIYGGLDRGNTSTKPVVRHVYAGVCYFKDVNVSSAAGVGWQMVGVWDSMGYHCRVDGCGGNPSGTFNGVTFTANSTPTNPAMHMLCAAPGTASGQFGYNIDTLNNVKFRDLTLETYRDGALWIDGSSGYWNGCNGLTFEDLKVDTVTSNGPPIVITAGLGGANTQQRKNYNIHINGLVIVQGQTYAGNTGPWDGIIVQDTAGLIIADALINVQTSTNGPPMKNAISFRGNNLGVVLHNVGMSGRSLVGGTPTYPLAVLAFDSGQNDVSATGWGRWDVAGGQLPLMTGRPTSGVLPPPIYGAYGGNGTNERTGTEYGGWNMWGGATEGGIGLHVTGEDFARFRVRPGGGVEFGSGSIARDSVISRVAAGVLNLAQAVSVSGLTGATAAARFVGATTSGAPASGTFAKGDWIVAQNGRIWVCTTAGSPGTWVDASAGGGATALTALTDVAISSPADGQALVYEASSSKWKNVTPSGGGNVSTDATGHIAESVVPLPSRGTHILRRTGRIAETFTRLGAAITNASLPGSGILHLTALPLTKGKVVSALSYFCINTAAVSPTNQWFALYDANFALINVTNDDTTNAWAIGQEKTLNLASSYTVTADALFYAGIMVAATTVPQIAGISGSDRANGLLLPMVSARSSQTGLTTPSTAPATVTTAISPMTAYVTVS